MQEAIKFGTRFVGSVSARKAGQMHLDQPVFGSVREVILEYVYEMDQVLIKSEGC